MQRSFAVRGVVEGFYGEPWTHEARLDVCTFLAARGMNAYAYAPKDDAKHRARWREPYDAQELRRFRELAAHASNLGVRFGFAISPGLDITYESDDDRATLLGKLRPLLDAGVPWFLLLLDDIPLVPGLAARQGALGSWLFETLRAERADADLTLCPTEYVGTHPSPYLGDLGAGLPAGVDVMWTGPTVCSPELRAQDARTWSAALGGRRTIVWDNTPVNDGTMDHALHLGAYRGRDPELVDVVGGVLCNPMTQARASLLTLGTAMTFLSDPHHYDADAAWEDVIDGAGAGRAPALGVLARACADGPLVHPDAGPIAAAVDAVADEIEGPGWAPVLSALAAELRAARRLPDDFEASAPGGAPETGSAEVADLLAEEVRPWADAARTEAVAGLAALRLLQQVRPVARLDPHGRGRAAAPDPETAMHTAFSMLYSWAGARTNTLIVYGPRFAVYPAVVQLPDGRPGLDAALAVREDANVIDRLCRLALAQYDEWRATADAPLRVLVDGEERAVAADGAFDARGALVLLRAGRGCTRVDTATTFPFRDPRLA